MLESIYEDEWKRYRAQRTKLGFILVAKFLAFIPFLLCVALVQQKLFGSKNMVMAAAILYGIFYVSTVFQMRKFPCPRCGKGYFGKVGGPSGLARPEVCLL